MSYPYVTLEAHCDMCNKTEGITVTLTELNLWLNSLTPMQDIWTHIPPVARDIILGWRSTDKKRVTGGKNAYMCMQCVGEAEESDEEMNYFGFQDNEGEK